VVLVKLWASLYLMVWLTLLEFLTLTYLSGGFGLLAHAGTGVAVLALAAFNRYRLVRTAAPARLKRIAKATLGLAAAQPVLGVLLAVLPIGREVVGFLHLLAAFAIITQAASTATAYDMWEEKEFAAGPPAEAGFPAATPLGP
jgi:hypothetical protein